MMNFDQFKDAALEAALELGCTAAEVYFVEGEDFEVNALNGKLDRYTVSRENGLNLRVQYDGKNGYAYTEALDDARSLAMKAVDNAMSIESTDEHPMQGKCEYRPIVECESVVLDYTEEKKIDLAFELERAAKAADSRVDRVEHCLIATSTRRTRIFNTLGLAAETQSQAAYSGIVPIVKEGAEVKDGTGFRYGAKTHEINELAKEAVQEAIGKLGASPAPAGVYRVILRNDAAASLLEAFAPMFSADAAQKGLSLLNGKEGTRIGSELVTLMDDPFYGEFQRAFDAEGVPSETTAVVDKGVLMTLLHNLKTAKKAGVQSTSNAGRYSVESPVGVEPSNFYIVPGEAGFDALVSELGDGLVVTELSGLHSGVNTISGDFSLLASGYLVEGGKRTRPVERITIGGSFLELLSNVAAVGRDLKFGLPDKSNYGSPSLLISRAVIAGD